MSLAHSAALSRVSARDGTHHRVANEREVWPVGSLRGSERLAISTHGYPIDIASAPSRTTNLSASTSCSTWSTNNERSWARSGYSLYPRPYRSAVAARRRQRAHANKRHNVYEPRATTSNPAACSCGITTGCSERNVSDKAAGRGVLQRWRYARSKMYELAEMPCTSIASGGADCCWWSDRVGW